MPETLLQENSLVIIGDEDIVMGFSTFGFKTYGVKDIKEAKDILDQAVTKRAAICLIQDNIYTFYLDRINDYRKLALPIFIPFNKKGKTDLLNDMTKGMRLRATGKFQ